MQRNLHETFDDYLNSLSAIINENATHYLTDAFDLDAAVSRLFNGLSNHSEGYRNFEKLRAYFHAGVTKSLLAKGDFCVSNWANLVLAQALEDLFEEEGAIKKTIYDLINRENAMYRFLARQHNEETVDERLMRLKEALLKVYFYLVSEFLVEEIAALEVREDVDVMSEYGPRTKFSDFYKKYIMEHAGIINKPADKEKFYNRLAMNKKAIKAHDFCLQFRNEVIQGEGSFVWDNKQYVLFNQQLQMILPKYVVDLLQVIDMKFKEDPNPEAHGWIAIMILIKQTVKDEQDNLTSKGSCALHRNGICQEMQRMRQERTISGDAKIKVMNWEHAVLHSDDTAKGEESEEREAIRVKGEDQVRYVSKKQLVILELIQNAKVSTNLNPQHVLWAHILEKIHALEWHGTLDVEATAENLWQVKSRAG